MQRAAQYKITLLVLATLVIAFCAGFFFGRNDRAAYAAASMPAVLNASSTVDMGPFWQVWNTLSTRFVQTHRNIPTTTDQDKIWGAIEGMTAAYNDPYTVFMPPQENKDFTTMISGNFGGVGMELGMKGANIVVIAPLKGTPAYMAGIKTGDVLLSINGTSTENMDVDTAVNLIRGNPGTTVTLQLARASSTKALSFTLTRAVINEPIIDTDTKGDIFIIHLYNFDAPSANDFRSALRQFVESGKSKLIVDLRGNPGGYLDAAVDMASWFLPLGTPVVSEDFGHGQPQQVYRSKGYNIFNSNLHMMILVDGGTASAAEILSGALSENGVAKLVGTQTFGKGSVQELLPVTSDTSLKITIARWLTPNGTSISQNGLTPDYVVPFTDASGTDPQMAKAISLLDTQ